MAKRRFAADFKRFFFRGLAVMLPVTLTLMIIVYVFQFIRNKVGKYLDVAIQWVVIQIRWLIYRGGDWSLQGTTEEWEKIRAFWEANWLGVVGIAMAFLAIYFIGRFMASFLGRLVLRLLEAGLNRVPVIKQVYPQVKQVTDFFFSDTRVEFSRVVAVEYPRKGIWSVGLVTAAGMKRLADVVGEDLLTIFIPSSPTPMTGYTITVSKEDVIDLPLSIDEAFRFTISGGVIQPSRQTVSAGSGSKALVPPDTTEPGKETEA